VPAGAPVRRWDRDLVGRAPTHRGARSNATGIGTRIRSGTRGVSSNGYCWRIRPGPQRSGIPVPPSPHPGQTPADRPPTGIPQQYPLLLTGQDDGLSLPWHGTVFVNPPYGRAIARWIAKARGEVERGNASKVVALIPARTDTAYWHEHIAGKVAVYFLR